jgi:hypothetical protein
MVRHDNVVGHEGPPVQVNLPLQLGVLPLQSANPELPLHGYYVICFTTKCTAVPHAEKSGRHSTLAFGTKCTTECRLLFSARVIPDRAIDGGATNHQTQHNAYRPRTSEKILQKSNTQALGLLGAYLQALAVLALCDRLGCLGQLLRPRH